MKWSRFLFLIAFLLLASGLSIAQNDPSRVLPGNRDEERDSPQAKSLRDQMEKMRIEKEKKDYQEMLDRGEQALRLSEQLEVKLETSSRLTNEDVAKLESLEKIVKKIRGDLGGDDDSSDSKDGEADDEDRSANSTGALIDAFRNLKSHTVKLVEELKKTTRFSISAAAIRSTNAVIKLTRFLRLRK